MKEAVLSIDSVEGTMTAEGPGPNVRRRQLGRDLRRLRDNAGLTLNETARSTGLTSTTISRIEGGKQTILSRNVRLLCQCYEVGAPMVDTLVRLAEESNERGWWAAFSDSLPDWFESFVGLESDAAELWNYYPTLIDGLLQTPEYAMAVIEAGHPAPTESDTRRAVELRQARQARLDRDNPMRLHVLLDEAALHRRVGGTAVMRDQLVRLGKAAQQDNITLQVIPFAAGAHPAAKGPFSILRFPEGYDDMDAVYTENECGALWLERPGDLKHYTAAFKAMRDHALSPEESRDLVDNLASSL